MSEDKAQVPSSHTVLQQLIQEALQWEAGEADSVGLSPVR